MRIGFYAPLKPHDHPVPSGDRQMTRLLLRALKGSGHDVEVLSTVRTYSAAPDDAALADVAEAARLDVLRIAEVWEEHPDERPDLLFAYHPFYKAPDCVTFPLSRRFTLPYATAEASHAAKRGGTAWHAGHALAEEAVRSGTVHFCFTSNDRDGLATIVDDPSRLIDLPPFIDASLFPPRTARPVAGPPELIAVAMMRAGDKARSYAFLAQALGLLLDCPWRLTIVGDGPARPDVEQAFRLLPPARIRWKGAVASAGIAPLLRGADIFVWPGFNEAYGLGYLEAQACGLPVIAIRGHGTPSVIRDQVTGLLVPPDPHAYAAALATLIQDLGLRLRWGASASEFVHGERDITQAAKRLDAGLNDALERHAAARSGARA